ncbi:hypothetical protein [Lentzea guizhouensis]|uniref:hypothetical protein n=1 Tax=Lentzea guizhouensis TaxID=1586287 RepID=UPI0012B6AA7A|nr:hypothetical protein [Lentzea guizhouensis]
MEVVTMGRNPHKGVLDRETTSDRQIVENALDRVRMLWPADRVFATLSGGERQRVLAARALTHPASSGGWLSCSAWRARSCRTR